MRKNEPKEKVNKTIADVHSRVARSFLLKEYLGDCDNASYNAALVLNRVTGTLRYAPNFDYGESFNKLIKTKIYKQRMSQAELDALPANAREFMLQRYEKEESETVEDIARQYAAADISKKNLFYVFDHFPNSTQEFFQNIDKCMQRKAFDKIVDSYTTMTCDGKPIMTQEEAEMFKDYLDVRATWMMELYIEYLNQQGDNVEYKLATEGYQF